MVSRRNKRRTQKKLKGIRRQQYLTAKKLRAELADIQKKYGVHSQEARDFMLAHLDVPGFEDLALDLTFGEGAGRSESTLGGGLASFPSTVIHFSKDVPRETQPDKAKPDCPPGKG